MTDRYSYYTFSSFLDRTKARAKFVDRAIPQQQWNGLDILVEDEVAKSIVEIAIAQHLHHSIQILPIGSASAVIQHLAIRYKQARYQNNNLPEVCAFLDGDMLSHRQAQIKQFMSTLENLYERQVAEDWINKRLLFLPGDTWPEAWIFSRINRQPFYPKFQSELNMSSSEVDNLFATASIAGKHQELRTAAEIIGIDRAIVTNYLIESAWDSAPEQRSKIISEIDYITHELIDRDLLDITNGLDCNLLTRTPLD
jgi:hypothetical protein